MTHCVSENLKETNKQINKQVKTKEPPKKQGG